MTPREQGDLEFSGEIKGDECTHFYHTLTYESPYGTEGNRTIGYTCANLNCKKFFPDAPYEKPLDITNVEEAKSKIEDLKVYGDGDTWVLLCKASSARQGWMKSTKVMNVPGGCVVQVTTQEQSHVAESVTYIPGVQIDKDDSPRKLVTCEGLEIATMARRMK